MFTAQWILIESSINQTCGYLQLSVILGYTFVRKSCPKNLSEISICEIHPCARHFQVASVLLQGEDGVQQRQDVEAEAQAEDAVEAAGPVDLGPMLWI
jgi:hypothetical protein